MRFWISGPRMFGGLIRPGVSFGREDFRRMSHAPTAMDFVYVITSDTGMSKIGITTNPAARLATLQTGSPDRLRMAFTAPAYGKSYAIEQAAHSILAAHRASGEWFAVSPDLAIAALFGAADRTGCSISSTAGTATPVSTTRRIFSNSYFQAALIMMFLMWLLGFFRP